MSWVQTFNFDFLYFCIFMLIRIIFDVWEKNNWLNIIWQIIFNLIQANCLNTISNIIFLHLFSVNFYCKSIMLSNDFSFLIYVPKTIHFIMWLLTYFVWLIIFDSKLLSGSNFFRFMPSLAFILFLLLWEFTFSVG